MHYCGIKSEAQGFGAVCEFGCGGCWSGAGFVACQLMPIYFIKSYYYTVC